MPCTAAWWPRKCLQAALFRSRTCVGDDPNQVLKARAIQDIPPVHLHQVTLNYLFVQRDHFGIGAGQRPVRILDAYGQAVVGLPKRDIRLEIVQPGRRVGRFRPLQRDFQRHQGLPIIEAAHHHDARNLAIADEPPPGRPVYAKGEQVMLFLHKPASETGFQTTAGLTQGKFTIRGDRIANGIGNESLFAGMKITGTLSPTQRDLVNQPGGAYAAEEFFSLVKTAVEEIWIENGVMTHED